MAVTIGIFEKEENVLEAIRLLRQAGVEQDEIRVIVNNREGAPILAASGDVNLEELYEIQETRRHEEDGGPILGVAPVAAGFPIGNSSMGTGPAGFVVAGIDSEEDSGREEILRDIGIPSSSAAQCRQAAEKGHFVLAADSKISVQALLSQAGADAF